MPNYKMSILALFLSNLMLEKNMLEKLNPKNLCLITDDNSDYLSEFKFLPKQLAEHVAYTTSVSTAPLPFNLTRRPLDGIKISNQAIIFSYRWQGILRKLENCITSNNLTIRKISERIIILENTNDTI